MTQIALQRARNALYRETVQMLLQCSSKLGLREQRYSGGLLLWLAKLIYKMLSDWRQKFTNTSE